MTGSRKTSHTMLGSMPKTARLAGLPVLMIFMASAWSYLSLSSAPAPFGLSIARNLHAYLFHSSSQPDSSPIPYTCGVSHSYTTQIVSLDPLVIYIHDFLSQADIDSLLHLSSPLFKPSAVTRAGRTRPDPERTSVTAFLPANDTAVACVLDRARNFAGTMLEGKEVDEMGRPQLVRYREGQNFNLHYDWYNFPQRLTVEGGSQRFWNRVGSFFAVLEDSCENGETWFPNVTAVTSPSSAASEEAGKGGTEGEKPLWREHERGGLAFRPVKGNALFWMNLDKDGKGDQRVKHAGLPVTSGQKTAMNIWPRRYFYD